MKALAWMPDKPAAMPVAAEELAAVRNNESAVLWVDYTSPTEKDLEFLRVNFGFERRTLAECVHDGQLRAKISDHGDYLFVVWPVLADDPRTLEVESVDLFVFLGSSFVVTLHDTAIGFLDEVGKRTLDDTDVAIEGSDWLLLRILDYAVDAYFPVIDRLSEKLDKLEDVMFSKPDHTSITELFKVKHAMLTLRRMAAPERDVANSLARFDSRLLDRSTFTYFQDVYDHLARVTDSIDIARDVIGGAMDIYLSSISNRMNDIMKRLTLVATIFMPMTFITSFYGMNVRSFSGPASPDHLWYIVAVVAAVTVGMLIDFRRRGWW